MKKIVFLEGIPGIGKTTLLKIIKEKNIEIKTVSEIINNDLNSNSQDFYYKNDEMKYNLYTDGIIVIDRGFISTLSYNLTKKIINPDYDCSITIEWFNQIKKIYQDDNVKVIYLYSDLYKKIPYEDLKDPYGSICNQKILHEESVKLCKKYVKNLMIINYNYLENMEEVINEIIN